MVQQAFETHYLSLLFASQTNYLPFKKLRTYHPPEVIPVHGPKLGLKLRPA